MFRLPEGHPARQGAHLFAGSMRVASHAATFLAVLALAWGAHRLSSDARIYLANAGGMPKPSLDYLRLLATSEGLHLRLMWWSLAWVNAVFAVGCAVMAVAGTRSLYWRIHGLARSA